MKLTKTVLNYWCSPFFFSSHKTALWVFLSPSTFFPGLIDVKINIQSVCESAMGENQGKLSKCRMPRFYRASCLSTVVEVNHIRTAGFLKWPAIKGCSWAGEKSASRSIFPLVSGAADYSKWEEAKNIYYNTCSSNEKKRPSGDLAITYGILNTPHPIPACLARAEEFCSEVWKLYEAVDFYRQLLPPPLASSAY